MKKTILFSLSLLLVLAAACKQDAPIKIGFVAGLTGTNSELGVNGMYGAILAVEEMNAKGGVHNQAIELIIRDDQSNPEIGLSVDKELVQENCVAIVGHMTSDMAKLSIPFINQEKILMVSPTIALENLSNQDDYFFRLIPSTIEQSKQFTSEIHKLGIKDVLIVSSLQNEAFAESIYTHLSRALANNQIATQIYSSVDFTVPSKVDDIVQQIMNSKAEALVLIASADSVVQISQALYNKGAQRIVFLPAWAMTNDLIRRGGDSVDNFYGVSFIDYQNNLPNYEEFRAKYLNTYGEEPTFAAIMSYESIMLLCSAMKESPDLTPENLKQAILAHEIFEGVQGKIQINKFGDAQRETYLYQIIEKAFLKVTGDE